MSLQPHAIDPVPEETARLARAAYPRGNVYIQLRDELGTIYQDQSFAHLFAHCGKPAEAPWRLLLVCLLQFAEGLSDRQAADAVRGRLDWKYLLSLEATDSGFDASVLCDFRVRFLKDEAEQLILQPLLDIAMKRGWLKPHGKQRTDSTHVLGAIRALSRAGNGRRNHASNSQRAFQPLLPTGFVLRSCPTGLIAMRNDVRPIVCQRERRSGNTTPK